MAIDESRRHALHESARTSFGIERGDTLMELLPPVGWADVATKHDLLALEERSALRLAALEGNLRAEFIDRLGAAQNHLILWLVSGLLASTAMSIGTSVALFAG